MRAAFARTLVDLAGQDRRILLLTGDLGYTVLEPFAERFPDRFVNVGVAEQNMLGLATGLAEAGLIPFCYSIATFASLRPYEFIRNGPVLHDLPVRIVGVGGGFEYGPAGPTHHAREDVAVMRLLPGLTVVAPADHAQAAAAIRATWDLPGPVYYRLGKDDRTLVRGLDGRFGLGEIDLLHEGSDALLLSAGAIAAEVAQAVDGLADRGVAASHAHVATLAPAPREALVRLLSPFATIFTVEAHGVDGGLGSLACEVVAERGLGCRVVRLGVRGALAGTVGGQAFLEARHGLRHDQITATVLRELGR